MKIEETINSLSSKAINQLAKLKDKRSGRINSRVYITPCSWGGWDGRTINAFASRGIIIYSHTIGTTRHYKVTNFGKAVVNKVSREGNIIIG